MHRSESFRVRYVRQFFPIIHLANNTRDSNDGLRKRSKLASYAYTFYHRIHRTFARSQLYTGRCLGKASISASFNIQSMRCNAKIQQGRYTYKPIFHSIPLVVFSCFYFSFFFFFYLFFFLSFFCCLSEYQRESERLLGKRYRTRFAIDESVVRYKE